MDFCTLFIQGFYVFGCGFIFCGAVYLVVDYLGEHRENKSGCHNSWKYSHQEPRHVGFLDVKLIGVHDYSQKRVCTVCGREDKVSHYNENGTIWWKPIKSILYTEKR